MNTILNFKNTFALPLLFTAAAVTAQNEIHSTATDQKYGNTTVVYTKDSNYNDQAILSQLDDSYGVGDVVRIAVAEPNQPATEMLASDDPAVMFAVPKSVPAATPKTVVMASPKKAETVVVKAPVIAPVETPKKVAAPVANIGSKTVKKGSIFRLEKLYFDVDKSDLKQESETELDRLFNFLNDNPGVSIEVRGHTNNQMWPNVDFANQLSTERAKAVADWLVAKGIAANRVQFKGFGWTMPVEPNINAEGRKKNQRVEVKILTM
ncbi:MAG TPA: OmpA family protein [Saprospiraceae bacterium]|nr:OmpA family protein [Saprospiraceae bacterium]